MKFDKARNLVKLLLVMCVLLTLVSIFAEDSTAATPCAVLSILSFVGAIIVIALWCRCPHCGKHIYFGLFKAANCPKCKRNLISGAKTKRSSR